MGNTNTNLWDSIQVDMTAEFDKVKVTLGDLKSIEEGLVVDLCSVYDNKIALKVGDKLIADGELIIINDRFGVRIKSVNDKEAIDNTGNVMVENANDEIKEAEAEEDFDYSDFEVEEKAEG